MLYIKGNKFIYVQKSWHNLYASGFDQALDDQRLNSAVKCQTAWFSGA